MEKGNLQKLKVVFVIYSFRQEICPTLLRLADSNGLIVEKLKRDLKFRGYVYFKRLLPNVKYQALSNLKTDNKILREYFNFRIFSSKEIIIFLGTDEHQYVAENIHKKYFKSYRVSFSGGSRKYKQNWIK